MAKTKVGDLHVKRLSVGGVPFEPKADAEPPKVLKVAYSEAKTIKELRADHNKLVGALRWMGIVGASDE